MLFNPLHYKIKDCPDAESSLKFSCKKVGPYCSHSHSNEERELARKALTNGVPRALPYPNEGVDWYEENLAEYAAIAQQSQSRPTQISPMKKEDNSHKMPAATKALNDVGVKVTGEP